MQILSSRDEHQHAQVGSCYTSNLSCGPSPRHGVNGWLGWHGPGPGRLELRGLIRQILRAPIFYVAKACGFNRVVCM